MSIPIMNVYVGGDIAKAIIDAKPNAALERDLADFLN